MKITTSLNQSSTIVNFLYTLINGNGIKDSKGTISLYNNNDFRLNLPNFDKSTAWLNYAKFAMLFARDSSISKLDTNRVTSTLSGLFDGVELSKKQADEYLNMYGLSYEGLYSLRKTMLNGGKGGVDLNSAIADSSEYAELRNLDNDSTKVSVAKDGSLNIAITNNLDVTTQIKVGGGKSDVSIHYVTPPVRIIKSNNLGEGRIEDYDKAHLIKDIRNAIAHNNFNLDKDTNTITFRDFANLNNVVIPLGWIAQFANYYISDHYTSADDNDKLVDIYVPVDYHGLSSSVDIINYINNRIHLQVKVGNNCTCDNVSNAVRDAHKVCYDIIKQTSNKNINDTYRDKLIFGDVRKVFKKYGMDNIEVAIAANDNSPMYTATLSNMVKSAATFFSENFGKQNTTFGSVKQATNNVCKDNNVDKIDFCEQKLDLLFETALYSDPKYIELEQKYNRKYFELLVQMEVEQASTIKPVEQYYLEASHLDLEFADLYGKITEYRQNVDNANCKAVLSNIMYAAKGLLDNTQTRLLSSEDEAIFFDELDNAKEPFIKVNNRIKDDLIKWVEANIESIPSEFATKLYSLIIRNKNVTDRNIVSALDIKRNYYVSKMYDDHPELKDGNRSDYSIVTTFLRNARSIYNKTGNEDNDYNKFFESYVDSMHYAHNAYYINRFDRIKDSYRDNQDKVKEYFADRQLDILSNLAAQAGKISTNGKSDIAKQSMLDLMDVFNALEFDGTGTRRTNSINITKNNLERLLTNKSQIKAILALYHTYESIISTGFAQDLVDVHDGMLSRAKQTPAQQDSVELLKYLDMSKLHCDFGGEEVEDKYDIKDKVIYRMRSAMVHGNVIIDESGNLCFYKDKNTDHDYSQKVYATPDDLIQIFAPHNMDVNTYRTQHRSYGPLPDIIRTM